MSRSRPFHADVEAAVRTAFPEAAAEVLAVLDGYGALPHEPERERVQLAIVALCGGSREKLLDLMRVARTDYRDILAWRQSGPLSAAEGERLQDEARALIARWGGK